MPGVMPYVMEKGPYFSVMESRLAMPGEKAVLLRALKNGDALSSISGMDSTSLDLGGAIPHNEQAAKRIGHLDQDWFGMVQDAAGDWHKQQAVGVTQTGFWTGYQGDPEAIMRAGIIGAIEVSLGLAPGDDPANATREWPIDFYWVCQGPWFQCWVLWRQLTTTSDGHVTVTITTPATTGHPLTTKITRVKHPPDPEYAAPPPPNAYTNTRGMWVFGHDNYTKLVGISTQPTPPGTIPMPGIVWSAVSTGVECVAPSEWEGGVLAAGRDYTP